MTDITIGDANDFAENVPGALASKRQYNQLELAVRKTGLDAWPRLWHNMRATRQTELESLYPTYVVCTWPGNSEATAKAHYLQVTYDDFEKASAPPGAPRQAVENTGNHGGRRI